MCYYQFSCFHAQTCTTDMRRVIHIDVEFQIGQNNRYETYPDMDLISLLNMQTFR